MNRFGVLIDLSGTIHIGDKLIGNSKNAIKRLTESRTPFKFISNTTKESKGSLVNRLTRIGFDISEEKIYTSLSATVNYLNQHKLRPHCLLSRDAMNDFQDVSKHDPNCVVVGLAPERFSYEDMDKAFKYVLDGSKLIATHKARYYRSNDDQLRLGPGPFITALEYACNTEAILIGKPSANFFQTAVDFIGNPSIVYMIGDDVKDDIDGAQKTGLRGVLVKTGKYREGDENTIVPKPYLVVESFEQAVDAILKEKCV